MSVRRSTLLPKYCKAGVHLPLKGKSKTQLRKERWKNRFVRKSERLTTCPHCGCQMLIRRAKKHLLRCPVYLYQTGIVPTANSVREFVTAKKPAQRQRSQLSPSITSVVAGGARIKKPSAIKIDLVRRLLSHFGSADAVESTKMPVIDSFEDLDVRLHVILLHDAGYIRCVEISNNGQLIYAMPCVLTQRGKRVLRQMKKESSWTRILARIERNDRNLNSISDLEQILS
jgi:hypothetical protein